MPLAGTVRDEAYAIITTDNAAVLMASSELCVNIRFAKNCSSDYFVTT